MRHSARRKLFSWT